MTITICTPQRYTHGVTHQTVEQWRPVVGYEGLYEVSDQGSVRTSSRIAVDSMGRQRPFRSTVLRLRSNSTGYLYATLWRDGKKNNRSVQRLVLNAFVGPQPPTMHACHNNGDAADNRLMNLRWATASENAIDKVRHGTHPEARKTHCTNGHVFDEANTYIRPDGKGRGCKQCTLKRNQRRFQRMNPIRAVANAEKSHCNNGHPFDEENTYRTAGRAGRQCKRCKYLSNVRRRAARLKEST